MRATHRIIGCTLCVAVMGSAAAATLDTQGIDHVTQAASSRASHGNDIGDGGTMGISHGDSSVVTSGNASTTTSRNGNDHSGAASSAPAPAPRPHLGWQSLLPGSIQ